MRAIIGLVPFLFLFTGLGFTRLQAHLVTFVTLVTSLSLATGVWDAPLSTLALACAEGAVTALVPIIWVIFAAVLSYLVSVETGAMEVIKRHLTAVTSDTRVQSVLIAFCFGGFLEAVAGFGTAVAIPTAMLISIGVAPVPAATMALVSNSVPVAFGALGIPVIALGKVTALDVGTLTRYVAYQLLPFAILVPIAVALIANRGWRGLARVLPDIVVIGVTFSVVQTLIAVFAGPELVAVGGSLASLAVYVAYRAVTGKPEEKPEWRKLLFATANFILLLASVLLTRLIDIPALKQPPFAFTLHFGEGHDVVLDWLTTPGTLLFIATLIGALLQGMSLRTFGHTMKMTASKIKYSALTIIFILMLAKTMFVSGMVSSVAVALAAISGVAFPLISPFIGAIGTFVTGSDTSSNILFGELQRQTATSTGFNPEWLTAANTSGATAGKMISPQSLSVATSVVGIESEQGRLLRQNLLYCLVYLLPLGVYVLLAAMAMR